MNKENVKETNFFKEQYGSEITMYDENETEHVFHLILELISSDGNHYAYFQSPDEEEGDIEVMRVVKQGEEYDLEFIEDDEEYESAAELFDEWSYSEDE